MGQDRQDLVLTLILKNRMRWRQPSQGSYQVLARVPCWWCPCKGCLKFVLGDHPFKTSANFSRFLTPTPLPSAVFYYYPSANFCQFLTPLILKYAHVVNGWYLFVLLFYFCKICGGIGPPCPYRWLRLWDGTLVPKIMTK